MRKIFSILLFTLALLSFSNASAEEKHMIYSLLKFDKNLVTHDGEYGYNLKLRFYNYDKNFYLNSESYKVQVKLWNDQDMKVPFPYAKPNTPNMLWRFSMTRNIHLTRIVRYLCLMTFFPSI